MRPLVIKGTEGMVMHFAKCCRPIPGDPVVGLMTAGRGRPCPQPAHRLPRSAFKEIVGGRGKNQGVYDKGKRYDAAICVRDMGQSCQFAWMKNLDIRPFERFVFNQVQRK